MVLALGVPNSGKTYTIIGKNQENRGLVPNLIENLLEMRRSFCDKSMKNKDFFIRKEEIENLLINSKIFAFQDFYLNFENFEIYNEEIIDLLAFEKKNAKKSSFSSFLKIKLRIFF